MLLRPFGIFNTDEIKVLANFTIYLEIIYSITPCTISRFSKSDSGQDKQKILNHMKTKTGSYEYVIRRDREQVRS